MDKKPKIMLNNTSNKIMPLNCYVDNIKNYPEDTTCELMQYTGQKDKNGKEIYEEDILKIIRHGVPSGYPNVEYITKVYFKDGEFRNCMLYDKEVIGNIYENPELLNAR